MSLEVVERKSTAKTRTRAATSLEEFARQNNFYIDSKIASLIELVLHSNTKKAFLFVGPAGVGKTQLTELIARYLNAEYIFFQCTAGTSEDDLLYKYVPSEETKSGVKITYGPIPRALKVSQNRMVVLVLDEFDKTRPSADALLLDVLQNHRVSLYLGDRETVIEGRMENLVIILTSNNMRELSEPLLRRLARIPLEHLPAVEVYRLLSKRFPKEVALLLTQIYVDTVNAGLRKPATIQELYQLGEILVKKGQFMPLGDLLRMFIIKYDDDWDKYVRYVKTRKPYDSSLLQVAKDEGKDSMAKYYEPQAEVAELKDDKEKPKQQEVRELLEKIRKLAVKEEKQEAEPTKIDQEKPVLVTLKIPDKDFVAYTQVIKTLRPPATDNPAKFGKFEYVEDEVPAITSREPLTIKEAYKLATEWGNEIEGYYEDIIFTDDADEFIREATKIKYYTEKKLFLEYASGSGNIVEKVALEKIDDISFKIKGYFKLGPKANAPPLLKLAHDYKYVGYIVTLLMEKPRNNLAVLETIDISSIDRYFEATPRRVATLIENLRRSPVFSELQVVVVNENALCPLYIAANKKMKIYSSKLGNQVASELGVKGKEIVVGSLLDKSVDRVLEILKSMNEW